ncbi:MAG: stage III sporulation protein AE [Defluviitaleaceae bacterium]|nr:stage III sporulation protein AE [Defluviitaleaceae bacterium]MCL2274633.1 stage III sporulation protein AE [Defluviitaleaceae bacterium]
MNAREFNAFDALNLERYDLQPLDVSGLPRFLDLARQAVRGELDLSMSSILTAGANLIFAEFFTNGEIIRQLLLVAILGALLRCLTLAFSHKSAGEAGFYVTYLMTVLLAISSFRVSVDILTSLVAVVNGMMLAATPVMVALMLISGRVAHAAGFHPLLFFALQLITGFITAVFIPLVLAGAALDIVNQLNRENKLDKLAALVRRIADYTLRAIIGVFMFLLTLQRISAPILNNVALRTTRSAAGAVPVVGNALTAAMDTVIHFSQAARSGVLVALVLVLCAAMLAPLLKILTLSWVYRITAAIMQPIADERLTACMDSAGKAMGQLFSAAALLGVMSIYTVVILLSF